MLKGLFSTYQDRELTATQCQNICLLNGMNYAAIGISDGRWVSGVILNSPLILQDCQCGTGIQGGSSWYPYQCDLPCPGDPDQTCGNKDVHVIFYAPPGTRTKKETNVPSLAVAKDNGYIGCYETDHSDGDNLIDHHISSFDAPDMTNEYCVKECAAQGATWAATAYGHTCHCGKDYTLGDGQYASDSYCSWGCQGDKSQICGGYRTRFSVYNVTRSQVSVGSSFLAGPGCKAKITVD